MALLKYLALCTLAVMVYAKDCHRRCTREYFPVCGSDLITYNNLCLLNLANCGRPDDDQIFVIHNGRCRIESCPGPCTLEYFPVCGTDKVTYGNLCDLENAHCANPEKNITLAYHGPCKDLWCPKACPKDYRPVCGSDNVTYGNLCSLEASNCDRPADDMVTLWYRGECVNVNTECDRACPLNFDPVCGTDGETYANLCAFETAQCKNNTLEIAHPGQCSTVDDECPLYCPRIWLPVCGSDGKTYANLCELDRANCNKKPGEKITIRHKGECKSTASDCTVIICPLSYIPVCGSNGNTYPNECYIRAANCRRPPQDQISIKYPGECRDIPSVCPKFCPLIWAPLCGTDNVTYGNPCHLEVTNCNKKPEDRVKKSYEGVCRDPNEG